MMRMIFLTLVLLGVCVTAQPALANCDIGGKEVPCATQNGHYRIRTPDGPGPHPVVVYLYGSLGNSADKINSAGFVQAFVERGYAVIVPAALDLRYSDGLGSGWHLRHEKGRKQRNEAAFVAEVIRHAEINHRIDPKRLLMAGMSRGGFLAWEIACHNPQLAAAYAPIAAGYLGPMPDRCRAPVRLMHTHGRSDRIVPLEQNDRWRSGGAVMTPLGNALDRIARTSGCITRDPARSFREYDRTTWQNCPNGSSVELLMHDGGHTIPFSWYSTVIDWFEGTGGAPASGSGVEVSAGARPRFKSVGQGSGSRFKRPKP